jgi:cytochrome c oxidase subunit 1
MMNETLGKVHFWLSFVGAYCIFMPFHYLGMAAMCAAIRHSWMTTCSR